MGMWSHRQPHPLRNMFGTLLARIPDMRPRLTWQTSGLTHPDTLRHCDGLPTLLHPCVFYGVVCTTPSGALSWELWTSLSLARPLRRQARPSNAVKDSYTRKRQLGHRKEPQGTGGCQAVRRK